MQVTGWLRSLQNNALITEDVLLKKALKSYVKKNPSQSKRNREIFWKDCYFQL